MHERPGAITPWTFVNQLLAPDERFERAVYSDKKILLAPKQTSQLAALLYLLHREGIEVSIQGRGSDIEENAGQKVIISSRAFSQITWHEEGIVEVGAGCPLSHLHSFLFERKHEVAFDPAPFTSCKRSIGSLLLSGSSGAIRYQSEGMPEILLGVECVTLEGSQVKWGGIYRSPLAGPPFHQLFWGWQSFPGMVVKVILKTHPIPPARLRLSWSFHDKTEMWKHWEELKRLTSSWDFLESVLSGSPGDLGFIFAQIAGLPEELEAFSRRCSRYALAGQQEERAVLKEFLMQQKLHVFLADVEDALHPGEYLWMQEGNRKGWKWAKGRKETQKEKDSIWKHRFFESFYHG